MAPRFQAHQRPSTHSGLVGSGTAPVAIPLLPSGAPDLSAYPPTQLAKRVIACLDVRSNDAGDLVVTKGDQVRPTPSHIAPPI